MKFTKKWENWINNLSLEDGILIHPESRIGIARVLGGKLKFTNGRQIAPLEVREYVTCLFHLGLID